MIGAGGEPDAYRRYRACGPMVVSVLTLDRRDRVADAAFVLFDPAWIAEQPAFVFADGGSRAGGGRKKRKIDF